MNLAYTLQVTRNEKDASLIAALAEDPSAVPATWTVFAAALLSSELTFKPARLQADISCRPFLEAPDGRGFLYPLEGKGQGYINAPASAMEAAFGPLYVDPGRLADICAARLLAMFENQSLQPKPADIVGTTRQVYAGEVPALTVSLANAAAAGPRRAPRGPKHAVWI